MINGNLPSWSLLPVLVMINGNLNGAKATMKIDSKQPFPGGKQRGGEREKDWHGLDKAMEQNESSIVATRLTCFRVPRIVATRT
jgi:hypothetical protein